jgi:cytosine permease
MDIGGWRNETETGDEKDGLSSIMGTEQSRDAQDRTTARPDEAVSPAAAPGGDFALSAVPESATTASYRIGVTLLATNISLPALVMGGQLGVGVGLGGTAVACFWGGLVLAGLSGICAYAGARSRLTTYVLIIRAFGQRGGELINLLLSFSAIGWFGIVVMLFAETMVSMVGSALPLWALFGMSLMTATTMFGFRALNLLSNVMLPAKLGLLLWAIWAAAGVHGLPAPAVPHPAVGLDANSAIAFVIGGWVVGAVVAPDFARYARSAGGGALACALALGVGYPLVLIAAAIPAVATGEKDLLVTMARLGMGGAALSIVLLASWTNGASNLYSGSLMLATVVRRTGRAKLIWAAGLTGMVLGLLGVTERIVPFLTMLSLLVPPIAGVYLPRFFIDERGGTLLPERPWRVEAFAALVIGAAVAGAGQMWGHSLTGTAALDSLLVSAASYIAIELLRRAGRGRAMPAG